MMHRLSFLGFGEAARAFCDRLRLLALNALLVLISLRLIWQGMTAP